MWCWPVSRYSKISDSCTIPMNMSLASALRLSGFWYFKMQLNFRRKWEKNLPSCSSYYIFSFVLCTIPMNMYLAWEALVFLIYDIFGCNGNLKKCPLLFSPFFVAFWFYSAHEQMFTSLILEMPLVNNQWLLPLGQFTIYATDD